MSPSPVISDDGGVPAMFMTHAVRLGCEYESLWDDTKRRRVHAAVSTQPVLEGGEVKSRIFQAQAPLAK